MELTFTAAELPEIASRLISDTTAKTLCFYGEMGAGKTTLIKAVVAALGGAQPASSPTFGLVNEYHSKSGDLLGYHFDFYRIEDEMEALDFGLEEYLYQDVWVFIEWPEKIASLLPEMRNNIYLTINPDQTRKLKLTNG